MAKVAIKSEELSPFGGIFSIMEQFDSNADSTSKCKFTTMLSCKSADIRCRCQSSNPDYGLCRE